jgi:hypothetical protein
VPPPPVDALDVLASLDVLAALVVAPPVPAPPVAEAVVSPEEQAPAAAKTSAGSAGSAWPRRSRDTRRVEHAVAVRP